LPRDRRLIGFREVSDAFDALEQVQAGACIAFDSDACGPLAARTGAR